MKIGRRRWSAALALALACLTSAAVRADDVKLDAPALEGLQARSIGPAAMSGRIAAIDGYVGSRQTLFVGAAGGGLWKSRDGGVTFKPIFDKYNQSIGAIRVSPADTNTIWVGTGESWTRNSVSVGDGVYKSTDGGDTWQNVGLANSEHVSKIEVNPKHPDIVFVGALGALWNDNVDRGVYRTKAARRGRRCCTRRDTAAPISRSTPRTRTSSTPRCGNSAASRGRSCRADPGARSSAERTAAQRGKRWGADFPLAWPAASRSRFRRHSRRACLQSSRPRPPRCGARTIGASPGG